MYTSAHVFTRAIQYKKYTLLGVTRHCMLTPLLLLPKVIKMINDKRKSRINGCDGGGHSSRDRIELHALTNLLYKIIVAISPLITYVQQKLLYSFLCGNNSNNRIKLARTGTEKQRGTKTKNVFIGRTKSVGLAYIQKRNFELSLQQDLVTKLF